MRFEVVCVAFASRRLGQNESSRQRHRSTKFEKIDVNKCGERTSDVFLKTMAVSALSRQHTVRRGEPSRCVGSGEVPRLGLGFPFWDSSVFRPSAHAARA
jgi:hypothetical protein